MGYSAFVNCNCYKSGKTVEPPHNQYMQIDHEGIYLDIPRELWKQDEERAYQMDTEFDEWKRTACEHQDMELAYEHLSNGMGMGAFRNIVAELGGQKKFPVLTEYLPTANGGTLPAQFAQQALEELNLLEVENGLEENVIMVEKSTGQLKAKVNSDTHQIFVLTAYNKYHYAIDKDGFFILENVKEKDQKVSYVVFRSNNFIQQTISEKLFRFIDIPTGESFDCTANLHPDEGEATANYEFEVTKVKTNIAREYKYMIEPLKKLALASVQSGNPIIWI